MIDDTSLFLTLCHYTERGYALDLLHKSSLALVTALVEVNELALLQEIYYT